MDKRILEAENEFENINSTEKNVSTNLRVATFCLVTSVNTKNNTINAQPLIKEKISSNDNDFTYVPLPELINVPYCTNMKEEPKVGDYCICIHLDRSIKGFDNKELKNGDGKSNNNRHNISDCVAIVGFNI